MYNRIVLDYIGCKKIDRQKAKKMKLQCKKNNVGDIKKGVFV
jgi:hypothetical protein